MSTIFEIPLIPLFQNLLLCVVVAAYSHLFTFIVTGAYRLFGNGVTEKINANPMAAVTWRLGCHWLGAVIGIVAILGL